MVIVPVGAGVQELGVTVTVRVMAVLVLPTVKNVWPASVTLVKPVTDMVVPSGSVLPLLSFNGMEMETLEGVSCAAGGVASMHSLPVGVEP